MKKSSRGPGPKGPYLVHAEGAAAGSSHQRRQAGILSFPEDLARHQKEDPFPKMWQRLLRENIGENDLLEMEAAAVREVAAQFASAVAAPEPDPATVAIFFLPTTITEEKGERSPRHQQKILMVDTSTICHSRNHGGAS